MEEKLELIPFVQRAKKRKELKNYQRVLLGIIIPATMNGETITEKDVVDLFVDFSGCRKNSSGVPVAYDYYMRNDKGDRVGGYTPKSESKIKSEALQHFMRNLGILIVNGYLSVLPKIDFSKNKEMLRLK